MFWPVVYLRTTASFHDNLCPQASTHSDSTYIYLGTHIGNARFGYGMHISLDMHYGYGTFSLRPSLVCYRVVSETSPGFALIRDVTSRKGPAFVPQWESAARDLVEIFQSRTASPHDRLPNGMTLLHVSEHLSYIASGLLTNLIHHSTSAIIFVVCV
jgi:hypothetical protein